MPGRIQKNRNAFGADVVSQVAPESAAEGRGSICPQADSPTGMGIRGRSAYQEPEDFTPGCNIDVGMGSREARSKGWGDEMGFGDEDVAYLP